LFTDRFTQAVPPEGIKPPQATTPGMPAPGAAGQATPPPLNPKTGSTNAPGGQEEEGITPEKRANILNLAHEAKVCQEQASKLLTDSNPKDSQAEQQNAYNLLKAIEDLLPKDKNKQQNQPQQNQQQDQQKQDQQKQDQQKQEQQPQEQKKRGKPAAAGAATPGTKTAAGIQRPGKTQRQ